MPLKDDDLTPIQPFRLRQSSGERERIPPLSDNPPIPRSDPEEKRVHETLIPIPMGEARARMIIAIAAVHRHYADFELLAKAMSRQVDNPSLLVQEIEKGSAKVKLRMQHMSLSRALIDLSALMVQLANRIDQ